MSTPQLYNLSEKIGHGFRVGLTDDGRQFLLGLDGSDALVIFFNTVGDVVGVERMTSNGPKDIKVTEQDLCDSYFQRMASELGVLSAPIKVRGFFWIRQNTSVIPVRPKGLLVLVFLTFLITFRSFWIILAWRGK